jgi:hypothetical protein
MLFQDTKEINISSYILNRPIFNQSLSLFISQFTNNAEQICYIKSPSLKIVSTSDNNISIEFLPSSNEFYKFILSLDNHIKNLIIENGLSWFNSSLSFETIDLIFKKSVNLPISLPSLPMMTFHTDDNTKIFYKKKKNKINIQDLTNNMEVQINFTIKGVNFFKNKCCIIYCANEIFVANDVCQSLECLLNDDSENNSTTNIESESYDINTTANSL